MKKKCLDYALDYIYRFPKTERELNAKLLEKGYTEAEIESAMTYLKSKKYVDDSQFVQLYLQSEVFKKGKSLYSAKVKLLHKGIDKKMMEAFIADHMDEINEGIEGKIDKEIQKYKSKGIEGFEIINKLMVKGYKVDDIQRAIRKSRED